jgi:hypothetical protein
MLVSPQVRIGTKDWHPELNASQRQAVDNILPGMAQEQCFPAEANFAGLVGGIFNESPPDQNSLKERHRIILLLSILSA